MEYAVAYGLFSEAGKLASLIEKAYVSAYPVGTRESRKSALEHHKELRARNKPAKKDGVGRAARDAVVLGAGFTAGYGLGGLTHYGMRRSNLQAGERFRAMTPQQLKAIRRYAGLAGLGVGAATLATRYARQRARELEKK